MRQIIVSSFLTLDGVMEAPGGEPGHPHTGWAAGYMGEEEVAHKFAEAREAGALLLGRLTYESLAEGWSAGSGPFAERMNAMPKYVASGTLRAPAWTNTTVLQATASRRRRRCAGARAVRCWWWAAARWRRG